MKIEIPFNAWSKKRLRDGIKSTTFRYRPYGVPGDTFEVDGKIYQLREITLNISGKEVIGQHWKSEGAASPGELRKVLKQICRGRFEENKKGVLHKFRVVWSHEGTK